jgi:hypothetical protein
LRPPRFRTGCFSTGDAVAFRSASAAEQALCHRVFP